MAVRMPLTAKAVLKLIHEAEGVRGGFSRLDIVPRIHKGGISWRGDESKSLVKVAEATLARLR